MCFPVFFLFLWRVLPSCYNIKDNCKWRTNIRNMCGSQRWHWIPSGFYYNSKFHWFVIWLLRTFRAKDTRQKKNRADKEWAPFHKSEHWQSYYLYTWKATDNVIYNSIFKVIYSSRNCIVLATIFIAPNIIHKNTQHHIMWSFPN